MVKVTLYMSRNMLIYGSVLVINCLDLQHFVPFWRISFGWDSLPIFFPQSSWYWCMHSYSIKKYSCNDFSCILLINQYAYFLYIIDKRKRKKGKEKKSPLWWRWGANYKKLIAVDLVVVEIFKVSFDIYFVFSF